MRVVWAIGAPATAREVHERVIVEHDVALLTVVTVLNKLVDKRLLQRRKHESLFHYEACLTESEFRAQVSRRVMEGILHAQVAVSPEPSPTSGAEHSQTRGGVADDRCRPCRRARAPGDGPLPN